MESRFFAQVEYSDECWEWIGHKHNNYGRFGNTRSHRWSYEYFIGPIPKGKIICHHCDNPPCVNPFHLYAGTYKDKSQDMIERGRNYWLNKTHCPRGHELSGDNVFINKKNQRSCKECRREADRKSWHKRYKSDEFRNKYLAKRRADYRGEE
jgi:hypothetical protein